MPDVRSPSELSIDEIVATVLHIIAEDEERGSPAVGLSRPNTASIGTGSGLVEVNASTEDADDILELTQAINEDGSVRQLAPIGPSLRAALRGDAASPTAAATPADAPDQRRIADIASRAALPPAARAAASAEPRPAREAQPAAANQTVDEIMRSLGAGDRSMEDIVREMLEPLLKNWLEEHLSAIVERQVRAELARTIDKPGF